MNIYGVATEAILQCFILDKQVTGMGNDALDNCPEPLQDWFADRYAEQ